MPQIWNAKTGPGRVKHVWHAALFRNSGPLRRVFAPVLWPSADRGIHPPADGVPEGTDSALANRCLVDLTKGDAPIVMPERVYSNMTNPRVRHIDLSDGKPLPTLEEKPNLRRLRRSLIRSPSTPDTGSTILY